MWCLVKSTDILTLHLQIEAEVNKLEEEGRGTAALTDELSDDMKVSQFPYFVSSLIILSSNTF